MRAWLLVAAVLFGWLFMEGQAAACSCLPPDLSRSYESADHVVHVLIERPLGSSATVRRYFARLIEDDFKGCLKIGRRVLVETASDSAACGVPLALGREYLLHGRRASSILGLIRLRVGLCDANVAWSALGAEQRAFLDTRTVCCGDECSCVDGSEPVSCLVDPCQVSSCGVKGAVCRANYCGGCNAEWYDPSGALVCTNDDACGDDPSRRYVQRDPARCETIRFACAEGEPFFDACGCGCTVPAAPSACKVGGCSGQRCLEQGADPITTCEWREVYACYRGAECARQPSGACGFTPTPELEACLDRFGQ